MAFDLVNVLKLLFVLLIPTAGHPQAEAQANRESSCKIFLVPGAFGDSADGAGYFINSGEYFSEYRSFFEARGCEVKLGQFPTNLSIEERAIYLKTQVEQFRKLESVILIAHSQGGLDARYAMKTLKLSGVSHLVTIGTPHQGTPTADWAMDHRDRMSFLYWMLKSCTGYDLKQLQFLAQMTVGFLKKYGSAFEAVSGVKYASAQGVCRTSCYFPLRVLKYISGLSAGDGMVPTESQKFGTLLGEYDLDHLSEVGIDSRKKAVRAQLLNQIWSFVRTP